MRSAMTYLDLDVTFTSRRQSTRHLGMGISRRAALDLRTVEIPLFLKHGIHLLCFHGTGREGECNCAKLNFNRKYHIWSNSFKKSVAILGQINEGKIVVWRTEKGHWRGRNLSYFLSQRGLQMTICPLINTKIPVEKRSKTVKSGQSASN